MMETEIGNIGDSDASQARSWDSEGQDVAEKNSS